MMKHIQRMFPSEDGNREARYELLGLFETVLAGMDKRKDPKRLILGKEEHVSADYYQRIINQAALPEKGLGAKKSVEQLLNLLEGHRFLNRQYVANATPLPNNASLAGNLMMALLNGNNLWDVDGTAAAKTEVEITAMLSDIVGYDRQKSTGFTTWGGQGAVFQSLRLAIANACPEANEKGTPSHLYAFCSELSHFSLYKSMQAAGIGTDHLIRIKANDDHSMNLADLREKMETVIESGGLPVYVLATLGTTDTFGIDDLAGIRRTAEEVAAKNGLPQIYIHADTAMGGMYSFFNEYHFEENPLGFEEEVLGVLAFYQSHFRNLSLADSLVFDFHKLGQTPYATSLFLVKDRTALRAVDLDPDETPYVGNRGFGSYHTSYTLECSRMGSSIPIYASLLAFGIEGYQELLANYIRVNAAFRRKLTEAFPNAAVTNGISPVTTFRFYPGVVRYQDEISGNITEEEVLEINRYNEKIAETLGRFRSETYFGSTKKQRYVYPADSRSPVPLYVQKFYSVSPYTTVESVDEYIDFLKARIEPLDVMIG
ncbi:pyridoxal-dependent decarboxylase [Bacillus sp. FSL M8-0052]|uniref:Aspartate aminotransferase family protein n=2 Tax=Bacillaceae TaxID=186817 RepID=A0AAJ4D1I4_9BACI|nr:MULTISPECIES: pyridoxal-dependent decarboxylase [Bacillus]MBU8787904.1 aspartate aminotransferase family protein [Bacillus glycinifermentans]MDU0071509.1 pyridoxal-dependent decarboxylase [Bacillus sp. IG6]MED8019398.1 pyridoxal-dependent decarboxylase [Bacillus glycinifermentans]NUJ18719.1 aspartate aminotransferase family protein [Bacillus glycinifermentans]QAT64424.1 aspartate aminotransferase family protein [Bacillus glycinifermentans]